MHSVKWLLNLFLDTNSASALVSLRRYKSAVGGQQKPDVEELKETPEKLDTEKLMTEEATEEAFLFKTKNAEL